MNTGSPTRLLSGPMIGFGLLCLVACTVLGGGYFYTQEPEKARGQVDDANADDTRPVINDDGTVNLDLFIKEAKADPAEARRKYGGKSIEFVGWILGVHDEYTTVWPAKERGKRKIGWWVACTLRPEDMEKAIRMSSNQNVKVKGKVKPENPTKLVDCSIEGLEPSNFTTMTAEEVAKMMDDAAKSADPLGKLLKIVDEQGLFLSGVVRGVKMDNYNPSNTKFCWITLEGTAMTPLNIYTPLLPGRAVPESGQTIELTTTATAANGAPGRGVNFNAILLGVK
jgi:hypothetical protein